MIKSTDSRQEQILTLLLNSPEGMSIDQLAARLEISRNAVKQHLVGLEMQHLLQEAGRNQTGGRPSRSYVLTEQGINRFPKQYAWFCNLLLNELAIDLNSEALERLMWRMGVKLANSLAPQFSQLAHGEKLKALIELMQSLGYHATLEQLDGQVSIKAVNCVYHDLAQKRPELCHFDRALIATLLDNPIQQTACMAKADCDCRFKIEQSQA